MNIVIVTSEYNIEGGGLSHSCLNFKQLLESGFGYSVQIVISQNNFYSFENQNSGFDLTTVLKGGYKKDLFDSLTVELTLKNLLNRFDGQKIDLIIAFGADKNGFYASELAVRIKTKLLILLRGSDINIATFNTNSRLFNYWCLQRAEAVVGLSSELIEKSKMIFNSPMIKYLVIPNVIETNNRQVNLEIKNKKKIVFGCGAYHLNEKKGVANLIVMMHHLIELYKTKEFELRLVGNIDEDLHIAYTQIVEQLNLNNNVIFLGHLTRKEFREECKKWDFYLQGSICEGFSNSVGDCISNGIPIILSNTGFIAEKLFPLFPQIILNSFIPNEMAIQIKKLLENVEIQNIYNSAYQKINEDTSAKSVLKLWEEILNERIGQTSLISCRTDCILSIVLHDISEDYNDSITTTVSTLESFASDLFELGFTLCSLKDYIKSNEKRSLIVCTFDDGYQGVNQYALPIFKKYGFNATVFVCSSLIGKTNDWNIKDPIKRFHMNESEIDELIQNSWEIGSHGVTHRSLLRLSDEELNIEIKDSKRILEERFGDINTYAYPYGHFNEYIKGLITENYDTAFTLNAGGCYLPVDNLQIRRYYISELTKIIKLDEVI